MANSDQKEVVIKMNNGQAVKSMNEIIQVRRRLAREFAKAKTVEDQKRLGKELKKVNGELATMRGRTRAAGGGLSKLTNMVKGTVGAFLGFNILDRVIGGLKTLGSIAAKTSDELADVQKTTGLTSKEVRALDKDLAKLNTRTPQQKLREIAKEAGRLGIKGVDNIRAFVEEADRIQVALGEDLGEDAVLQLGKISDAFDTSMTKIGSAINTVGASTKAQEQFLVNFLSRTQGTGVAAGIAATELIGYGAAFDSLGLPVEMTSTALNKVMLDFIKNTEDYGAAAGFASGELSELVGADGTNSGFLAFIERLKEANPEAADFMRALEGLGITGDRSSQAILAISNNLDLVTTSQQTAGEAFEAGTSILDEFNTKNNNMAANLEKVRKFFQFKLENNPLTRGMEQMAKAAADYVSVDMSEQLMQEQTEMKLLAGAVMAAAEGHRLRNGLLQELMDKYPAYFGNLDKEKATNEDIMAVLEKVNKLYRERIRLAVYREDLTAIEQRGKDLVREEMETAKAVESIRAAIGGTSGRPAAGLVQGLKNARAELAEIQEEIIENEMEFARTMGLVTAQEERVGENDPTGTGGPTPAAPRVFGMGESAGPTEEELAKALEQAKAMESLILELRDVELAAIEHVEQREISQAEERFERDKKRINSSKATAEAKNMLILAKERELATTIKKIEEDAEADAAQVRKLQERRRYSAERDAKLKEAQLRIDLAREGSMEELEARMAMLHLQTEIEIQQVETTEEQKLKLKELYEIRVAEMRKKYADEVAASEEEKWKESLAQANEAVGIFKEVMSSAFEMMQAADDAKMESYEANRDAETMALRSQLRQGLISQEEFDRQKAQMDEQTDRRMKRLKRKQFEREKRAAILQAVIETALGVASAIKLEFPMNIVMMAMAAAAGAAQVAAISSQANPYYKGGRTKTTDTEGNTYMAQDVGTFSGGGYYSTPSVGIIGEKGEELVIPNHVLNNPDYMDHIAVLEGAIARQAPPPASVSKSSTANTDNSAAMNAAMVKQMERNNAFLHHLMTKGVEGVWSFNRFRDGVLEQEKTEGRNYWSSSNGRAPGVEV